MTVFNFGVRYCWKFGKRILFGNSTCSFAVFGNPDTKLMLCSNPIADCRLETIMDEFFEKKKDMNETIEEFIKRKIEGDKNSNNQNGKSIRRN